MLELKNGLANREKTDLASRLASRPPPDSTIGAYRSPSNDLHTFYMYLWLTIVLLIHNFNLLLK